MDTPLRPAVSPASWLCCGVLLGLYVFVTLPPTTSSTPTYTSQRLRSTGVKEYCHFDSFNASCGLNQVIVMEVARYGRMKVGACVKRNLGYLGCSMDVLRYMDSLCSGQRSCKINVVDLAKKGMKPCPDDVTHYLEASYKCVEVRSGSRQDCQQKKRVPVPGSHGFLASVMASEYGYGSSRCPWHISAQPGQRINITLHNFARYHSQDQGGSSQVRPDACYEFALLKDGASKKNIVGCVGEDRHTHIYTSVGRSVELHVLERIISSSAVHFMIEYNVIGCPTIRAPPGGSIRREGQHVTVRCNHTEEIWYLTCRNNRWIGEQGNCSLAGAWNIGTIFGTTTSFPYGILVVVAIGVALGVFFGGLLLFGINIYMKRSRRSPSPPSTRTIEEVTGTDKLMAAPLEAGYPAEVLMKARNSAGPPSMPPLALHQGMEEGSDTISVREYKGRNGSSEVAHVHIQQQGGGGGGQYGRAGFLPYPHTGTLGRPPSHVYESPKFS